MKKRINVTIRVDQELLLKLGDIAGPSQWKYRKDSWNDKLLRVVEKVTKKRS